MAEYNVTTFEEFLTAISDNDTTKVVNCPQNAEWDASDFEPEGHTGTLKLYGTINGNGTKIKNLVIKSATSPIFDVSGTTTDLHIVDGVWNCDSEIVRFSAQNSILQLCTLSASAQNATSLYGSQLYSNVATVFRCAANIEVAQNAGTFWVHNWYVKGKYNNLKISGSKVTNVQLVGFYGNAEYSSVILDTPMITTLAGAGYNWSILRCTGANVTNLAGVYGSAGAFSLGCSADFPNAEGNAGFVLCTEAQLRDAAYLQSIGFPIGV